MPSLKPDVWVYNKRKLRCLQGACALRLGLQTLIYTVRKNDIKSCTKAVNEMSRDQERHDTQKMFMKMSCQIFLFSASEDHNSHHSTFRHCDQAMPLIFVIILWPLVAKESTAPLMPCSYTTIFYHQIQYNTKYLLYLWFYSYDVFSLCWLYDVTLVTLLHIDKHLMVG